MAELIIETKDTEYMKQCIERREEFGFGFDKYSLNQIIIATNDAEFIKGIIEKREELGLKPNLIREEVKATKDSEYIQDCIERKEEFGFNLHDIVCILDERKKVNEYIDNIMDGLEGQDKDDNKIIKLDEDMSVGIEIESEGINSDGIFDVIDRICEGWEAKR